MTINYDAYPFPSQRMPVFAANGVVATSQPLAAQAGLSMLQRGGNAIDAALAAAIALTVVEPTSNGIGGDAFALVWDGTQLHGLNGSGRAPAALKADKVRACGYTAIPIDGWLPVTVPGAPAAWGDLHQRFGRLPLDEVMAPAIEYAEDGFGVTPIVAKHWAYAAQHYLPQTDPALAGWAATFAPGGHPPPTAQRWACPDQAHTLRRLAQKGVRDFYEGELAAKLVEFARATGGLLTGDDLASHYSQWVDPISAGYRGYEVWEIPPNGQGLAALMALSMLEGTNLPHHPYGSTAALHLQLEAMKLAFADVHRYVADPAHAGIPLAGLLDPAYLAARRALIGSTAGQPAAGQPQPGDTVYLCTADRDGMMVSYIQSNYQGFGSGVVIPGTGIALHDRGAGFSLQPGHPNEAAGGKRPFHTIVPAFLTAGGKPVGPFGVMGAHMQPQGHVQVALNTVDYGFNPQAALDAPRWKFFSGLELALEPGIPESTRHGLADRGHVLLKDVAISEFGRGQIIWQLDQGLYAAGSDPRSDGAAVGW